MKSGKYWMIPVAGLRRWLASESGDVDDGGQRRLQSVNPPGERGGGLGTRVSGPDKGTRETS